MFTLRHEWRNALDVFFKYVNSGFAEAGSALIYTFLGIATPELFAQIAKSEDVPETIRGRARQMASVLGTDAVGDVDELIDSLRASSAARARGPQQQ